MGTRDHVQQRLDLRPGERALVAGLLLHSLLVGAVLIFTLTAANALFVSTVGPSGLAYVYLAVAVVGPLSSAAVLGLGQRLSQRRTWRLHLLVVTLVPLALRWLLAWGDQATAAFALLVWYRLAEILLNLEFWGLAASLLHVRQAKRLYGLIGSGEVVALVVGGFTLPLLVSWIGSDNIILLAAGASALCLPLLGWIQRQARSARARRHRHPLGGFALATHRDPGPEPLRSAGVRPFSGLGADALPRGPGLSGGGPRTLHQRRSAHGLSRGVLCLRGCGDPGAARRGHGSLARPLRSRRGA